VLERVKTIYKSWLSIQRNLPKSERYNLGQKIDNLLLDILETLRKASFSPIQTKIALLGEALTKIDSLRFLVQLCWELKLIPSSQFMLVGADIEEVGKMVGGWYKGLVIKTSAETEEKK
jgi:hypothetical protein